MLYVQYFRFPFKFHLNFIFPFDLLVSEFFRPENITQLLVPTFWQYFQNLNAIMLLAWMMLIYFIWIYWFILDVMKICYKTFLLAV